MKKLYASAFLLCTVTAISAQEVLWQKDIKSSTQDFLSQVTTTIDQQYLITGSSIQPEKIASENKQNNGYDLHLMKLDQQGNEMWEKYFSGKNHDFIGSTVATQEGGFLISATTYSSIGLDKKDHSKGGSDIWLIRINEFGDELWQKTLGSSSDEEAKAVIQTTDFGFLVAGNVTLSFDSAQGTQGKAKGYGSKDVIVSKLDKNGKELSQIILGGRALNEIEKMIPTLDGGALLGIYSRSGIVGNEKLKENSEKSSGYSKRSENFGEGDFWVVKLNKEGKVEWEKNFGGTGDDHLRTLALTSTGFLIGGESRSPKSGNKSVGIEEGTDLWLISLNDRGEELWQKSYNFKNRDVLMGMNVVSGKPSTDNRQPSTKGILLGGYTQAEGRIETEDETFWMLYLDQNGNEQWRKHVKGENRQREERLSDIRLNRDGSIILAGTSAAELGKENWKIVKLGDKQLDQLIEKQDIKIYPNPVTDYAYVELGFEGLREGAFEAEISVYDMGGRKLETVKTKNKITKINTQPLIQGAYLVVVKTNDKAANAKMIKK